MPAQTLARIGFTSGVKTSFDPSSVPVTGLWEARNVRADDAGVLRIRHGTQPYNQNLGNGTIQGMAVAFNNQVIAWDRDLYKINADGSTTKLRGDFLGATATDKVKLMTWARNGAEICYVLGGNGLFQTDGVVANGAPLVTPYTPQTGEAVNLLRNTDGTQNLTSGPAKCKLALVRASLAMRMIAAGNPSSPNSVYMSAPLDATYWPSNQTIQLPDDGGKITGLANWYNCLIIFRDRDIWAFFGSDVTDPSAKLVLQDASTGCISDRTIANVPGVGIAFLGPDNVYALQQVVGIENQAHAVPVGDDIRKFLLRAKSDGTANACGYYFNREYWLSFPDAVEPERVFRMSLQHEPGWYIDTGPRVVQFVDFNEKLYAASIKTGSIYQFDETKRDDSGENIPIYLSFRREELGFGKTKIKRIFIFAISKATLQHLNVSVVTDGGEVAAKEMRVAGTAISDFVIGKTPIGKGQIGRMESVTIYEARFSPSLHGRFAQVRLSGTALDEDIAILGYAIEYSSTSSIRGVREGVSTN